MGANDASTRRTLRIGVIGSGKMGRQHLAALKRVAGAEVAVIADPMVTRESLGTTITAATEVVATPEELMDRKVDVVHIVTPPSTHPGLARLALERGMNIYVEKPFTLFAPDAEALFALAQKKNLRVCAGHQLLFEPVAMKAAAAARLLGRIVSVESVVAFRMVRRNITPVEQVKDILPHAVYLLLSYLRARLPETAPVEIRAIETAAEGEVHVLLRLEDRMGRLSLTLQGRPIDQHVKILGVNGAVTADFVTGALIGLPGPGASAVDVLLNPYRSAWQSARGATGGFYRRLRDRRLSYPGLPLLFDAFYESIRTGGPSPLSPASIVDTVRLCEAIGAQLDRAEEAAERHAAVSLAAAAAQMAPPRTSDVVLVTGGTGFLGKRTARELRQRGFRVRVVSRRLPPSTARLADVDYVAGDLSTPLTEEAWRGVTGVVHCAAETAGGQDEHTKNSVDATRVLIDGAAGRGIRTFVHVSSLAVLQVAPNVPRPLSERTPVDSGNLERGPYVWGKAESEVQARRLAPERGVPLKIVRPGPLVDYEQFKAPGRLGRELGPLFLAVGPKRGGLAVCDVGTAARVLAYYVEHFDEAPELLNLVEPETADRRALVERLRAQRPELGVLWMPAPVLKMLSVAAKLAFRVMGRQPMDVYAAFAGERYDTAVAAKVVAAAGR